MINPLGDSAEYHNKYISYKQCLPGCSRTIRTEKISDKKFTDKSGTFHPKKNAFNDLECSSYTETMAQRGALSDSRTPRHDSMEEASDKTSMYIC